MRWIFLIGAAIFGIVSGYGLPITLKNMSIGNILIELVFIAITVWLFSQALKEKKPAAPPAFKE